MTDFSKAYTAEWHLYRVNRDTWADTAEVGLLVSASITRDSNGDAPEIDSGTLAMRIDPSDEWEPGYYRLAMRAFQDGAERFDVATLLCESDSGEIECGRDSVSVLGRSVLHPAATAYVRAGDFAAAGQDGAQKAAAMLRECINAPVSVTGAFVLEDNYDFGIRSSVLEAAWELLRAGGFCMRPNGRGEVEIMPMPSEPSLMLDRSSASLLMPSVSYEMPVSGIPNRFTASDGAMSATAVNDDPSSPASHAVRGYWFDESDDSPARLSGETLGSYAARKLEEASVVEDKRTYSRRWAPEVYPFDIVRGSMPSVGLSGDMRVKTQSIECGHGVNVSETAAREVRLWSK